MEDFTSFQILVYKLDIQKKDESKRYKSSDVKKFVKNLIDKGFGEFKLTEKLTISQYYDEIKDFKDNQTSRKFKTSYFIKMFDLLEKEGHTKSKEENRTNNNNENQEPLSKDEQNMVVFKKIEKLEYIQRIFLEVIAAQSVIIKALTADIDNSKVNDIIDQLLDSFEHDLKYDLPFDKLSGNSYIINYDEDLMKNIRKQVKQLIYKKYK